MTYFRRLLTLLTLFALVACAAQISGQRGADSQVSSHGSSAVEDIYVFRSVREERQSPDEFCAASKVGFAATDEGRYGFKSVVTRAMDGKVVDAIDQSTGMLRACFDGSPGAPERNFYAEAILVGVAATGRGKCTNVATDYPEPGVTSLRCFLVLTALSPPYFAGVLTTNTIISRATIGPESDPPGYIQPSIATIRLWRRRSVP